MDKNAGWIFRKAPPTYTEKDSEGDTLMGEDPNCNPFEPFSSKLDWMVAHWAVNDGPGHNAFTFECCLRLDRKSTRLNSSHPVSSRMPSSA